MVALKTRTGKSARRDIAGTAAIEFAISIALLAVLVTGIVEVGFSMYQAMQVSYAAEAGLFYAAKNGWNSSGITNAAVSATGLSGMTATASQSCGCPSTSGIATVTCGSSCASGTAASQYININVSMTRRSVISNAGLGLPVTISAQSILRQN
ncbi:MAG: TadE/TadG family type IV pilus assembly protein [Rhodomicrobium sp.]